MAYTSALTYYGNKASFMKHLAPLISELDDQPILDAFCGGLGFALNAGRPVVCNDSMTPLIDMYKALRRESVRKIELRIKAWGLSFQNRDAFLELSAQYNKHRLPVDLYLLYLFAYSNLIRFNDKGEYNVAPCLRPKDNPRTGWNISQIKKLKSFLALSPNLTFTSKSVFDLDFNGHNVFLDPPYLAAPAHYNGGWDEDSERKLLRKIDESNCTFILTNIVEGKTATNKVLKKWMKKHRTIELDTFFKKRDGTIQTVTEVIVTNI